MSDVSTGVPPEPQRIASRLADIQRELRHAIIDMDCEKPQAKRALEQANRACNALTKAREEWGG